MVKTLTVSVDDWIMDEIVVAMKPKQIGRSEWVRKLLILGMQSAEDKKRSLDANSDKQGDVPMTMGPYTSKGRVTRILPRIDHELQMRILDEELGFYTRNWSQHRGYSGIN